MAAMADRFCDLVSALSSMPIEAAMANEAVAMAGAVGSEAMMDAVAAS